jgi:hypothetical protein
MSYYDSPLYRVRIQGDYTILTYYNRLENVKELARYLNKKVAENPNEPYIRGYSM